MAQVKCRCNNILSNTQVPNEVVIHQFTDIQIHDLLYNDSVSTITLSDLSNEVWHCSNCDRLYYFNSNGEVEKVYQVEV